MAPGARLALLWRALSRRAFNTARDAELELWKKQRSTSRMQFESDVEQSLNKQDLKLKGMESDVDSLREKIDEEVGLYIQNRETHEENLKGAIDDLQFSFIKGTVGVVGVSAAVCSLIVNLNRLFPGACKGCPGCSAEKASQDVPASPAGVKEA